LRSRRLLIVVVAALAVAAAVVESDSLRRETVRSVMREPTPFTELYFTNHVRLPTRLRASRPNVFSFTIANHEGRATSYAYVVTARSGDGTTEVARDTITIERGGAAIERVAFTPRRPNTAYLITVRLRDRVETIHFRRASSA
jgi:hypothetical protein